MPILTPLAALGLGLIMIFGAQSCITGETDKVDSSPEPVHTGRLPLRCIRHEMGVVAALGRSGSTGRQE